MVKVAKNPSKKGGKNYENAASSGDDSYDGFDSKDPFKGDEIEEFYNKNDKVLLNTIKNNKKNRFDNSSDEEEVLAFSGDEDDDEEYEENDGKFDDDDEDDEEEVDENLYDDEEGLVDAGKSWGTSKSAYYSGNKIDNEEDADLEEEEARILQSKIMKQLDASDFDLDLFKAPKPQSEHIFKDDLNENLEKITKNLSKLSKSEKLAFLKQESPELIELARDFDEKIAELTDKLIPIYNAINMGTLKNSNANAYILSKLKLNFMYCCHLSFYFLLKAQRLPVDNHPIIKNILQLRNMCKQVGRVDEHLNDEVDYILDSLKNNRKIVQLSDNQIQKEQKKQKRMRFKALEKEAVEGARYRNKVEFDDDEDDGEAGEGDMDTAIGEDGVQAVSKRAINYKIEKNKGLTPHRNKLVRNPRVKHREKYRKALIKRKSVVPKVRSQDKRYSGEQTGIRVGVVRSVKLK